LGLGCWV